MTAIKVIRSGQWTENGKPAYEVEGHTYGAPLTLILEDMPGGGGPRLHRHPYDELWVCQAGAADFTDGDEVTRVGPGDIVFAPAGAAHKFTAVGDTPLKMVCIHCSPKFSTEWLEPSPSS
jgi:mannose-6-phosphate isomerase-like protein (cupin superfamily)